MTYSKLDIQRLPDRAPSKVRIKAARARGGVFVKAVQATRVPMLVTDATLPCNPIVFANPAFLAMSGYAMDEVMGREPHFMDGPRTNPATVQRLEAAAIAGQEKMLDLLQYRKDGSTLCAAVFVDPWKNDEGQIIHHFLSFHDVTRRVEAEADLRALSATLEGRVAERTGELEQRTDELEAANERLVGLLAERKVLLDEVNHRAKNSLMIASSLLSVQARRQQDVAVSAVLEEAQSRLLTMARVHDLLSLSGKSQQVFLADYLRDVCSSLAPSEDGSRIRIVVDAEGNIPIGADRAVAIGMIVNELTTNALKYAFPPPRGGTVEVRAHRPAPDQVILTVRDDGIGMPAGLKGNLGFGIVRALGRQIDAEIEVDGEAGVSTTISFRA